MVAIISNMQKGGVPVIMAPEMSETRTSKRHVILTSWASVTTALLIMMFIGGAFYVADLKSRECTITTQAGRSRDNTKDYSRTYDNDGIKTQEDFYVDEDDQSELIIKKSADGNIEMITGIDYKTKISATYIPSADQCVLLAGTHVDMVDEWSSEKNKTVKISNDDIIEEDYLISGNKVSDLSILPKVMKPYCQGKPTFWAQLADKNELESNRQKRDIICSSFHWIYIWDSSIGGYRIYYFIRYYPC